MRSFSIFVLIVGLICSLMGLFQYFEEDGFLSHAVKGSATIIAVRDDPVVVVVQGKLSGSRKYTNHVCRYTVRLNTKDNPSVSQLTIFRNTCLSINKSIPVIYDSRAPSDTMRDPDNDGIFHSGMLTISFGIILIVASLLDIFSKQKKIGKRDDLKA